MHVQDNGGIVEQHNNGRATGWIPMHDVRCMGNKERLIDCRHRNSTVKQDCTHDNQDASVVCQPGNSLLLTPVHHYIAITIIL